MTGPTRRVVSGVLPDVAHMPYRDRVRTQPDPTDIDGLLAFHRATFGDARMDGEGADGAGADGGAAGTGSEGAAGDGAAAGGAAKTFTQAELDAIVARKEREAKTSAAQKVADELGVPLDKAKELVKQATDAEAAKLTEAEKREKAAADKEAAATAREAAAVARERDATIRATLAEAGCTKDDITDAKRLVDIPDGDVDEKAVGEAVEALKKRRPELFGGKRTPTAPAGFTPPGAPTPSQTPTNMDQARERYRKQQEKSA